MLKPPRTSKHAREDKLTSLFKKKDLKILGPWLAGQEPSKILTATSLAVLITLWHAVLDCSD